MKKLSIILTFILISITSVLVFALISDARIKEIHNISSIDNSFVVDDSNYSTTSSIKIKNTSSVEKSFDLVVFFSGVKTKINTQVNNQIYQLKRESSCLYSTNVSASLDNNYYENSKILLVDYLISANQEIIINVDFDIKPETIKFVAHNNYGYNYYVSNAYEMMTLNNEYLHQIDHNDSNIKELESVYIQYEGITSYDDLTPVQKENCYGYLKNKYVLISNDNQKNFTAFYYKKQIFNDVYMKSAFKNIYLLNDLYIDTKTNDDYYINFPCNINLLYCNISLEKNLNIVNYYEGIFHITTKTGTINYHESNFNVYSPCGYTSVDASLIDDTKFNLLTNKDAAAAQYKDYILKDAANYLKTYLQSSYFDETLGEEVAILMNHVKLPKTFFNTGITYQYKNVIINNETVINENGYINRKSDTTQLKFTFGLFYQNTEFTDNSYYKFIDILGTSDLAILTAVKNEFDFYIAKSQKNNYNNEDIHFVTSAYENSILYKYRQIDKKLISISVNEQYKSYFDEILENGVLKSLVLRIPKFISQDITVQLIFTLNNNTTSSDILLQRTSTLDKTLLLKKYYQPFFIDVLSKEQNLVDISNPLVSNLNYLDIKNSLQIYNTSTHLYKDLTSFMITYNEPRLYQIFKITKILTLEHNEKLLLKTTITYADYEAGLIEEEKIKHSQFFTEIIIPASGISGDNTPEYVADVFEKNFNNHQEVIYAANNSFSFRANNLYFKMEVNYDLTYASIDQSKYTKEEFIILLNKYFELKEYGEKLPDGSFDISKTNSHYYEILVNTEFIPLFDTTIYISVKLSDHLENFELNAFTQDYSFMIPGILFCGTNGQFNDPIMYQYLLQIYNDDYISGDIKAKYLLLREARKDILSLDLSKGTIINTFVANNFFGLSMTVDDLNNHLLNIKGLEYLEKLQTISFDDWKLDSATSLSSLLRDVTKNTNVLKENIVIKSLSFNNCGLTDEELNDFYLFRRLNYLNLNNNSLTKLPNIFRSVSYISLANQSLNGSRTLFNIDGISDYVGCETIVLSNNAIKSFTLLLDLIDANLKQVFLEDNVVIENTLIDSYNMYGTAGEINKTVMTWLNDNGVLVYNNQIDETKNGLQFQYYYDKFGKPIKNLYLMKENFETITSQKTDLIKNGYYYGMASNLKNIMGKTIDLYYYINFELTKVNPTETIYIRLPFSEEPISRKNNIIINSFMYESFIKKGTESVTITFPPSILDSVTNISYIIKPELVNNVITTNNPITITEDVTHIIISITIGELKVFRELIIRVGV